MTEEKQLNKLAETFHDTQIEWRAQTVNAEAGWALMVPYITARAVQSRLDESVGAMNWKQVYKDVRSHDKEGETVNMLCGISIRCKINDELFEWVTKWDGAQPTDIEGFKGSISGAFRRAAVSWGIGRFLYDLEPAFVNISTTKDNSKERMNFNRVWYYYDKPKLPKWVDQGHEPEPPQPDPDLATMNTTLGTTQKTWEDVLSYLKDHDDIKKGISKVTGGSLLDAIDSVKGKSDKELCSLLIKYVGGEK